MRLRRSAVRGIGWGLATLVAVPGVLFGAAGVASASASSPDGTVCGVTMDSLDRPPLTLRFQHLHHTYPAGGAASTFRLKARNGTGVGCPGIRPVVVFGARGSTLGTGDVRLEWRRGKAEWTSVRLVAVQGALAGQIGPAQGLSLAAGGLATVPLRVRFASAAPTGQWLTMSVGYEPVTLNGQVVPLPVGITDPHYFRVVRREPASAGAAHGTAPQLAVTGGTGTEQAAVAGVAALAVAGGAGLLLSTRRGRLRLGR